MRMEKYVVVSFIHDQPKSYLNKKIIVCRKTTERPESIGTHSFMCGEPELLEDLVNKINENYEVDSECPYGNGKSWKKIVNYFYDKKKRTHSNSFSDSD